MKDAAKDIKREGNNKTHLYLVHVYIEKQWNAAKWIAKGCLHWTLRQTPPNLDASTRPTELLCGAKRQFIDNKRMTHYISPVLRMLNLYLVQTWFYILDTILPLITGLLLLVKEK